MAGSDRMTIEEVVQKVLRDEHADVIRESVRVVAAELMEAEVSQLIGAELGERRPEDRATQRNGYRPRRWDTRAGEIELQIPKLRQGSYFGVTDAAQAQRAGACRGRAEVVPFIVELRGCRATREARELLVYPAMPEPDPTALRRRPQLRTASCTTATRSPRIRPLSRAGQARALSSSHAHGTGHRCAELRPRDHQADAGRRVVCDRRSTVGVDAFACSRGRCGGT